MDRDIAIVIKEYARKAMLEDWSHWCPHLHISICRQPPRTFTRSDYSLAEERFDAYARSDFFAEVHCRMREVAARTGGGLEGFSFGSDCSQDSFMVQLFMAKCADFVVQGFLDNQFRNKLGPQGKNQPWKYAFDITARLDIGKVQASCRRYGPHPSSTIDEIEMVCILSQEVEFDLEIPLQHLDYNGATDRRLISSLRFEDPEIYRYTAESFRPPSNDFDLF